MRYMRVNSDRSILPQYSSHNSRSLLHSAPRLPMANVAKRTTRTSVVLRRRPVGDYRALQAGHRQDKVFIRRVCMIIGVVARSPAPPAGPPCCGLGGLLCGLPRVGGLLRLPRGLLFRRPVVRLGPRHDRLVSSLSQRARKACAACA